MEEDISIINSNTRNERVRNFFINNKNKIISTIVVLIIVLVGAYSFDSYKTNIKTITVVNNIEIIFTLFLIK